MTEKSELSAQFRPDSEPARLAYKISEAATMLGVSQVSIRRAISRGLIRPCRAFRHPLIPVSELHKLLESKLER